MAQRFTFSRQKHHRLGLSDWDYRKLREQLTEGVYWYRRTKCIFWNELLLEHLFLVVNRDQNHPEHQALIEEYQKSLPRVSA